MPIRYMIDRRAVIENGQVVGYEPIGVWVHGPGPNDIEIHYLPGIDETEQYGFWVINQLVENDITTIPADFLEHHCDAQSPYHGSRGAIAELKSIHEETHLDGVFFLELASEIRV